MHTILTLILTMIVNGIIYKKNFTLHKNTWNWHMGKPSSKWIEYPCKWSTQKLIINVNRVENRI
jgi:hypothetical protein